MSKVDYDDIREKAEAARIATPGPFKVVRKPWANMDHAAKLGVDPKQVYENCPAISDGSYILCTFQPLVDCNERAEYFAAMTPTAALSMLDRIAALEALALELAGKLDTMRLAATCAAMPNRIEREIVQDAYNDSRDVLATPLLAELRAKAADAILDTVDPSWADDGRCTSCNGTGEWTDNNDGRCADCDGTGRSKGGAE